MKQFPNKLENENFVQTSLAADEYNCIAWAAGRSDVVIWPDDDEMLGWPPEIARVESVDAFAEFFGCLGYKACASAGLEAGFEKIAIYARDGSVTHAARQLSSGRWTSKLGPGIDAEHADPEVLAGGEYGSVVRVLRRHVGRKYSLPDLHPPPPKGILFSSSGLPIKKIF